MHILVQKYNQMPVFKHCHNFSEVSKDMPAQELEENRNKVLQGAQTEGFKVVLRQKLKLDSGLEKSWLGTSSLLS